MARPRGTGRLSELEVAEMAHYARCGWTLYELASHYGLSERTVQRILRRMPQEPLRASRRGRKARTRTVSHGGAGEPKNGLSAPTGRKGDGLRDIGAWLAGVMADHGGRSAMVRTMVVDGEVVLAANIYTQGGGMGTPSAALIHLLGGDQVPVTLGDLYGISKEGDDGVDAGRRVETGGGRSDAAADGHMADCAGNLLAEGVAPITAELRAACGSANDMVSYVAIDSHDFDRLCDAIDAVHAALERENAELRAKLDNIGESMHDGWVRLPLDADGESR